MCDHSIFKYRDRYIHVPDFLNSVAKYKPNTFWIWLIYVEHPTSLHINLQYYHLAKEEAYYRYKQPAEKNRQSSPKIESLTAV